MTDLVEFLRARLDEDESAAQTGQGNYSRTNDVVGPLVGRGLRLPAMGPWLVIDPARLLAEVQAKRALLEVDDVSDNGWWWQDQIAELLALPYADHPEYDQRWSLPERTTE